MVDDVKNSEILTEEKENMKIKVNKDFGTPENTIKFLKSLVDSISSRFTKKYTLVEDEKSHYM
jgi:hypothetical protein